MNGKLNDDELQNLLQYYIMANTYGKHTVKPENRERVFNILLALNELNELRSATEKQGAKNGKHDYNQWKWYYY